MTAAGITTKKCAANSGALIARLDKSLAAIQCVLVLVLIVCHTVALPLIERLAEPPSPLAAVVLLLGALACFLSDRETMPRRWALTLVLAETLLITAAAVLGLPRLFPVMYVIIVARAGLLVSSKELVCAILVCALIYLAGKEFRYLITERAVFSLPLAQHLFHLIVVGRLFNFLIAISFSALCVSALKGERKSRIERQNLNLEVEQMSKTLERTRIAREIHDNVGHTLTSLNMQLELAQKLLERKPERIAETLIKVKDMAQRARLDLKTSLTAPEKESAGLKSKLQSLVSDANQLNAFSTELFVNAPEPDERIQHEVYCIVKEALNNVKKYADAKTATVTVAYSNGRLLVDVEDDGTGFDTKVKIANKYGLRGMSERAELIGGDLKVESRKGSGTKVMLSVPHEMAEISQSESSDAEQLEVRGRDGD